MQMLLVSTGLSAEMESSEEEYFIYKMLHGNDWSRLPTDAEINEALSKLPYSEDESSEFSTTYITYSYGSPQKVHVLYLKDNEKYRFYANQVIITVVRTYESQSKLFENMGPTTSQMEYYLGLHEVSEGIYEFGGIGVAQKGSDGERSPIQRPLHHDGSTVYGSGWIDGEPGAGSPTTDPTGEEPYPTNPEEDEDLRCLAQSQQQDEDRIDRQRRGLPEQLQDRVQRPLDFDSDGQLGTVPIRSTCF